MCPSVLKIFLKLFTDVFSNLFCPVSFIKTPPILLECLDSSTNFFFFSPVFYLFCLFAVLSGRFFISFISYSYFSLSLLTFLAFRISFCPLNALFILFFLASSLQLVISPRTLTGLFFFMAVEGRFVCVFVFVGSFLLHNLWPAN